MKKNTRKNVAQGKVFSNEMIAQKINLMSFRGRKSSAPSNPLRIYFGSFTNISLREIERELTEVNGSLQPIVTFMKTYFFTLLTVETQNIMTMSYCRQLSR